MCACVCVEKGPQQLCDSASVKGEEKTENSAYRENINAIQMMTTIRVRRNQCF